MRYKLLAVYGMLVILAACTFYAILKLSHQSPEALPLTRCQSDKIYPDLTDCTKFYICSPDGPELFLCPLGFHFNPTTLICDWVNQPGCFLNDDASPTILSFETTFTDEIVTGHSNEQIISSDLNTNSPSFETTAKITTEIDYTILNITSNVEKTTLSNNNANTAKISQSPIVSPGITFTIIKKTNANETGTNPILTSINNFKSEFTTVNPNDTQSSVPTTELDITSDYNIKANRNDSTKYNYNIYTTEVTKDFTHENKVYSTDIVNSEGRQLFEDIQIVKTDASSESTNKLSNENRNISSNTKHLNNDRNSTTTSEDIIQNTENIDTTQFSNDISGFGQNDYDASVNTKSKNNDNIKSHIEIPSNNKTSKYGSYTNINELEDQNITVSADNIKVVAEESASQYMKSSEGNFKSDIDEETYPNQRVTEELSTGTPTHFYDEYSKISSIEKDLERVPPESINNTHSKMNLVSTVGQFTDTTSSKTVYQITDHMNSNNNSPSAVNPFDENNGQFSISSGIPTNDLYSNNGNSDLATATYSGNKDSKISLSYDGDREITNVGPDNINDTEINAVEESAIDSSTNVNENILVSSNVSDNEELPKYETVNVIDNTTNKDFWKEANSVFLSLTSSDENAEEGIITTTTNTNINISGSIYSENLTSEHLNNYLIFNNISTHKEHNNDIEYNVVSSQIIDDKTIRYISNREDMYPEIEKDSSHGYTPSVSYSEFVDGTNLNYKNNDAVNEITNESFLPSTDVADTFTGNTFAVNNFYDNNDERVTSDTILLNEQKEASSSTANTNKSIIDNPISIALVKKNFEIVSNSTKDIVIKFNTNRVDIFDMDDTTNNVLENGHNIDTYAKNITNKYVETDSFSETEYNKEVASTVSNRKINENIMTKIVNVNNNENNNSSSRYETNSQKGEKVIFSSVRVIQSSQSTQQIVLNNTVINIPVSIKNNSNNEKNNSGSTYLLPDDLNSIQYSKNLEVHNTTTSEYSLNIVENMSTMNPHDINRLSTDIKSETYFPSNVQENFSISNESMSSAADLFYDNLDYSENSVNNYMNNNKSSIELAKEKYITDSSFETTENTSMTDIDSNTTESEKKVTDNKLDNILQNTFDTYSSKDDRIIDDSGAADNDIFSSTISSESSSNRGNDINNYYPYSETDEIEISTQSTLIEDNRKNVPTVEYISDLPYTNEESNIENNIFSNNNVAASILADDKKGNKAKGYKHDNKSKYLENEDGIILSTVSFSKTGKRGVSKDTEGIYSTTSVLVISDPIFTIDENKLNIVSHSNMANEENLTTAQLPINLDDAEDVTRVVISSTESVSVNHYISTDYRQEQNQYSEMKDNGNIIYNYINNNNNNSSIESANEQHITDISSDTTESNIISYIDLNTTESPKKANYMDLDVKEHIFPSTNTSQHDDEANYYTTNQNRGSQDSDKENKIIISSTISSVQEHTVTYDSFIREEDSVDSSPSENSRNTSEGLSNNEKDIHIFSTSHSNGSSINLSTDSVSVIVSTSNKNSKISSNNDYLSDTATDAEIDIIDNVQFSTEVPAEATKNSGDIITNKSLPTNITHKIHVTKSSQLTQEVGDHSINKDVDYSPFNDIKPQLADVTNDNLENSEFSQDSDIAPEFLTDKSTYSDNSITLINDLNSTDNQDIDTSIDSYSDNINSENMNKYSSSNSEINIDHQISSSVKQVTEKYFINDEHVTTKTILNIDNDGSKLTNELGKEDSVLVATTLNENYLKNDPSIDLAQRLKDKIIFSSKSKFNMDKPASLEVVQTANLSILTEQITSVKVNHNNNQTFQIMQNSTVTPLQNIKIEKMYTTNLLKSKVSSYQSVTTKSNISSNDDSISINKDNETISNRIEQTESMIEAIEKFSTSIPNISTNISKEMIYKNKQTVSYIFNKSSIHIALNSSVSHLTQQQSYSNAAKYITSYSEEKINSIRKQLMQIISDQYPSENAIIKNIFTRYKHYGTNDTVDNKYNSDSAKRNSMNVNKSDSNKILDSKNAICIESNDNIGDKDEKHTDENGNAAYKIKAKGVKAKEAMTGADDINEYNIEKYNNKERNNNENNNDIDDTSEENTNKYNTRKGNTKEEHTIENTAKGDKRKEYNIRGDSRKEDNIDVNKNTVEDPSKINKNQKNHKNENVVKVSKNQFKMKEANTKDNNIKEDNMKGGYTEEQNKNKDNTDKDNTEEDNTNENNTSEERRKGDNIDEYSTKEDNIEEDSTEEDSTKEDSTEEDITEEDSIEEDSTEEESTEEDSAEEDNTEEDHAKAYNSFDNNFKDDRPEDNTKENSTEEDDIEESRENRYLKIGKDNIDNDIYKETVKNVENRHSSEESKGSRGDSDSNIEEDTIENVDSKDDSNNVNPKKYNTNGVKVNKANIIGEVIQHELSAIEDIINKTNDKLNAEKYYIRRLLQAANATATNNNDNNMRPLNNRYDRKNKSKYNKKNQNRKLSPEKEIDVENRQYKYQRKSKKDIGTTQEKYQGRNKHESNNRNRKWRTLTNKEENKEDNRKHKGKHAFILNIKKVIFEKSLKDINWEL